jgi:hypothetical protein
MLKDFIARLTSYKTTLMAAVTGILTVLVAVKVVQADALTEGVAATGQLFDAVLALLGAISSIALLFSKDSSVVEKETIMSELEEGIEE